jgi:hypothetical protein
MNYRIIVTGTAVLVLLLGLGSALAKANFTGTWVMDKSKSEGTIVATEQTMTITQDGEALTLQNKMVTDEGELLINDSYVINGKEVDFTQKRNEIIGKGKRTAKWSADGNGFESVEDITFESPDGQTLTQHVTRKWVLAADGKSFTVELENKGPNGSQHTKRLFVKK